MGVLLYNIDIGNQGFENVVVGNGVYVLGWLTFVVQMTRHGNFLHTTRSYGEPYSEHCESICILQSHMSLILQ